MSTTEQSEAAIRSLLSGERDRLVKDLPKLFPELDGDAARDRIMHDDRPRPALSRLLGKVAAGAGDPGSRLTARKGFVSFPS